MLEEIAGLLSGLKAEFAAGYRGGAHIQEVVPSSPVDGFPEPAHLEMLHGFARHNPIYTGSYEQVVRGVSCVVYEGDIGAHWLDSTKHGTSCQPFYPTWMTSAYTLACMARDLGYSELVDVGSGDGRIAYCGALAGLVAHSVEIDAGLAGLQREISRATGVRFAVECGDALATDYTRMGLERPVFFIGALAQMGGDILASGVLERALGLGRPAGMVLTGSHSERGLSAGDGHGGWGGLIGRHGLAVGEAVDLPTVWTFDQDADTPYIHVELAGPASK